MNRITQTGVKTSLRAVINRLMKKKRQYVTTENFINYEQYCTNLLWETVFRIFVFPKTVKCTGLMTTHLSW